MSTDYILPALNVDDLPTEVSGQFFQDAVLPTLADISYTISVDVRTDMMNQIFLFHTADDSGNSVDDDLSDLSNTDIKYGMHYQQWNLAISTVKNTRKLVVANLLSDLFGHGASEALKNVDVFSNEDELDADISGIFNARISARQRDNIALADSGQFSVHGSAISDNYNVDTLGTQFAGTFVDVDKRSQTLLERASSNPNAITAKLLEQAALSDRTNGTKKLLNQFGPTNNSNSFYYLPTGWRTFQFDPGDRILFNVTITQPDTPGFLPTWAVANAPSPTNFRVILTVSDNVGYGQGNAGNFARLEPLSSFPYSK